MQMIVQADYLVYHPIRSGHLGEKHQIIQKHYTKVTKRVYE